MGLLSDAPCSLLDALIVGVLNHEERSLFSFRCPGKLLC